MTRTEAVAGQFYPDDPRELAGMIDRFTLAGEERVTALGALAPHAGYVFSGETAGAVFGRIVVPPTVILLCPSHHFMRPPCALWTGGPWRTPLGDVALHEPLVEALAASPAITPDDRPHVPEHSAEVVVPFIQRQRPEVRMAFLCVTGSADVPALNDVGAAIAGALAQCGEDDALVVASSDMSHEDGRRALEVVEAHDPVAISHMETLDGEGLVSACRTTPITMCGVLPATAMMASVRARGGTRGELVARATSADSPYGRGSYVVGYAGMIFRKAPL